MDTPMIARKRRITFDLDAEMAEHLDVLARRTGRPRAQVLRDLVGRELNVQGPKMPGSVEGEGIDRILALAGSGRGPHGGRSAEEIDAMIDWLRGSEVDR